MSSFLQDFRAKSWAFWPRHSAVSVAAPRAPRLTHGLSKHLAAALAFDKAWCYAAEMPILSSDAKDSPLPRQQTSHPCLVSIFVFSAWQSKASKQLGSKAFILFTISAPRLELLHPCHTSHPSCIPNPSEQPAPLLPKPAPWAGRHNPRSFHAPRACVKRHLRGALVTTVNLTGLISLLDHVLRSETSRKRNGGRGEC